MSDYGFNKLSSILTSLVPLNMTIDALDPYGKIPEFKFCAVRMEKCG